MDQLICDKRKFQQSNMFNDTIRMKKKKIKMMIYSFTPSHMNFQAILMPKEILAKFCHKKSTH